MKSSSLLLVVWMASATPVLAAPPGPAIQVVSLGLKYVDIAERKGDFFLTELDQGLIREGVQVVSRSDVQTLLGIEREKLMLGCSEEESACLAEISNALGVGMVLTGQIARIGRSFAVSLRILQSGGVKALAIYSKQVSSEEELLEVMSRQAPRDLTAQLRRAVGGSEAGPSELAEVQKSGSLRARAWIPAAVAGGLLVGGAVSYGLASGKASSILTQPNLAEARATRASGESLQTAAFALGAGALVGLAVAGGFYLFGDDGGPAPSVSLSPEGASLGLAGTF